VRLAKYVALELAVGTGVLVGGFFGVWFGGKALLESRPARAAVSSLRQMAAEPAAEPPSPAPQLAVEPLTEPVRPKPLAPRTGIFIGYSDEVLSAPLRDPLPVKVKFNRGGSSVSMRVDLSSGGRGAFKPDQTNLQSIPRKEVAAYRVNRLLGLSSVAPAVPAAFPRQDLVAAMVPEALALLPRFNAEVPSTAEGMVTGSLAWWIPDIVDCKIEGFGIDSTDGIAWWKRYLTIGEKVPERWANLVPQISNLVVFDFLTNNFDRWSGSNTKCSPDGKFLYFMDNALAFGLEPQGNRRVRVYLERAQKFSRRLYLALKALDRDEVEDVMMTDTGPWPRLLTPAEIDFMMKRRDAVIAYIDGLIAVHGESAVLAFP
jgi:hypothetical protein